MLHDTFPVVGAYSHSTSQFITSDLVGPGTAIGRVLVYRYVCICTKTFFTRWYLTWIFRSLVQLVTVMVSR